MRERVLEAKYASIFEEYGDENFVLMSAAVYSVRSGARDGGPNMKAKGTRVTAEEVMTTRLTEGARWAAFRTASVTLIAGVTISRS